MAVSLNSQSKQSQTEDIRIGLASVKAASDEQGTYWVLPGQQEKLRCKETVSEYAARIDSMIQTNLVKGKHRTSLI